jgi:protein required for attachment to host cells
MLGELRGSLEQLRPTLAITELERDLTKVATAELRDRLAVLGLLPPRPQREVTTPSR